MIIIDKPYISEFFRETIRANGFPVLKNDFAVSAGLDESYNLIEEPDAVKQLKNKNNPLVFMPTENSIGWVMDNLGSTRLPEMIRLFKDKVQSRKLMRSMYPEYYFRQVELADLDSLDISGIPMPFVIKPVVGFCSFAVCKVENEMDWEAAKKDIKQALATVNSIYPAHVLDFSSFIIEEFIQGDEFAFDACYDKNGKVNVFSVYQHIFASKEDVSDRLYITSSDIVREYEPVFNEFLTKLGELAELKNFPLHGEVRIDYRGRLIPIEINPMRFGGMCTTADLTSYAYGYNPYEYCFTGKDPQWQELTEGREDYNYGMVLLNNTTGIEPEKIKDFNHKALAEQFEDVLEIRKINHREFHFFGFLFIKTRKDNFREMENILHADLREYISV
jgi:ATP-grasp domain